MEPDKSKQYFQTDDLKLNLKTRSVQGGVVMMVAQVCMFALTLGSTMVLARLLAPEDFGLIAMVMVVTGFATMFKDIGLSIATIQKEKINHSQISTLFWINVAFSIVIMVSIAAIAPALSWFYKEPRLVWITLALASIFIFDGLTAQHQALLKRQMNFGVLATVDIIALLISIVAAVVSAWYGYSYWAIVIKHIVLACSTTIGVWLACNWRPGLPVRGSNIRSMLEFGGNITGFNIVNYFSRNADNLLIGWVWGAGALGLYAKVYSLVMVPISLINSSIMSVAIPALSRLQHEPEKYRRVFLRILEKILLVILPPVALLIVVSDWIIVVVLGPQWTEASPIFTWLSIIMAVQVITGTTGLLFITQGRTRDMFQWGIVGSSLSIISFIIGLPWGPVGIAASYTLSGIFLRTPILLWWVGRKGPVRTVDFIKAVYPFFLAFVFITMFLIALRFFTDIDSPAVGLALACVCTALVTLAFFYIIPSTRRASKDMWILLRSIKKDEYIADNV